MNTLVINSGSSSIKYVLFKMKNEQAIAKGLIERIGENDSSITHIIIKNIKQEKHLIPQFIPDHKAGLESLSRLLTDDKLGVVSDVSKIELVGHRVVHGGEVLHETILINEKVKNVIDELSSLAPLHNPANLQGIEVAEKVFTQAKQVAVFDTAFHQSMPAKAFRYPIPDFLYKEHCIRSYGMHGTSHRFVSQEAIRFLQLKKEHSKLITIHLGNGCSISAIKNGKCIDTSMGLSPLAGLMMGTRSGDIDPSIPFFLSSKLKMSFDEIYALLNKESGLKGIASSNDMRDVLTKKSNGDQMALLAVEMYVYRIQKYIGAYAVALGGLDAVIFTAGVGENSHEIRSLVCSGLASLGVYLDEKKNQVRNESIRNISTQDSIVQVLIVPTNEELEIARQALSTI